MAVKLFDKTGRGTAMVLALAALALPGMAMAQDQDRGGWRRGGEAAGNIGGGSGRQERAARTAETISDGESRRTWSAPPQRVAAPQAPQQAQSAPAPAPQGRWSGNGGNWQGRSAPPPAVSVPEPAPQARWNGNPSTGQSGGGERRGGWNGGEARTSQPAWQGRNQTAQQERRPTGNRGEWNTGTTERRREDRTTTWRGDNNQRRDDRSTYWRGDNNQRRNGDRWRDANRDRRDNDSWRGNNATNNRWRDSSRQVYRDGRNWNRWDNNWRRNNRYDWYSYRSHNPSAYRWGSYYAPYRGYSYSRLSIGFFLDSLFYGDRYWINDPWQYRLPDVYGPYRWVRYYDDAVLVDVYTGEVVDVIYDFFW